MTELLVGRFAVLRVARGAVGAAVLLWMTASAAFGQQTDVTRFDAFAGYAYFNSPLVGLVENGFHLQTGVRVKRWMSLGFDYSRAEGDLTLTPDLLVTSVQQQLTQELTGLALAGLLPKGYALTVPAHSVTQTFAAGPQFSYRHFKSVTLFLRPSLGAMLETATPHATAGDQIAAAVVAQLAPAGNKKDRVVFYGFGGGVDINFSHHIGLRVQADFVHDHLFDDLLKDSRNTVRFSVGPTFNFGPQLAR